MITFNRYKNKWMINNTNISIAEFKRVPTNKKPVFIIDMENKLVEYQFNTICQVKQFLKQESTITFILNELNLANNEYQVLYLKYKNEKTKYKALQKIQEKLLLKDKIKYLPLKKQHKINKWLNKIK